MVYNRFLLRFSAVTDLGLNWLPCGGANGLFCATSGLVFSFSQSAFFSYLLTGRDSSPEIRLGQNILYVILHCHNGKS